MDCFCNYLPTLRWVPKGRCGGAEPLPKPDPVHLNFVTLYETKLSKSLLILESLFVQKLLWLMLSCSRPKLADFYTLSQTKLLENQTLHSRAYLHGPYLVLPLPPQVSSTLLPTPTGLLICYSWAKVLFLFPTSDKRMLSQPTNLSKTFLSWNVHPSFAPSPAGFSEHAHKVHFQTQHVYLFLYLFSFR